VAEGARVVRVTGDMMLLEIRRLKVGGHVHLNELLLNAPAPGSLDWLPIASMIATRLDEASGRWVVKLPLGTTEVAPVNVSPEFPQSLPDLGRILEPPSVVRCSSRRNVSVWAGQNHRWQQVFGHRSLIVVSVSRSAIEARDGDPFVCEQLWEIQ
jgi:hypothetical protein